jgi:hypothetical protein
VLPMIGHVTRTAHAAPGRGKQSLVPV